MDINSERVNGVLVVTPKGRMDAYGALALDESLDNMIQDKDSSVVFNMEGVSYLSSGGIRTFLRMERMMRDRGGKMCLCNLNPYPLEVLKMAGFDQIFSIHPTVQDAMEYQIRPENHEHVHWSQLPEYEDENLSLTILEVSQDDAKLQVVGDISKVLNAQIGEEDIYSRNFYDTEYSIGLGGLGEKTQDFMEIMGEMITIGGTMVWLPTDGHDTPDFLIPKTDTGKVTIHTGFNVALDGDFHDVIMVKSKKDEGFTVDELYSSLFHIARKMKPSFKGVISVAMQADIGEFYSSGVKISPIKKFAPENCEMIMHPDNIASWMNISDHPTFQGETMLSFGVGVDLESDLSSFDEDVLGSLFYMHPANIGNQKMLLHNHAVVFKHQSLKKTQDLDDQIRTIVRSGDFLDMRHLLDNTIIKQALIGVSYISDILFEKKQKITLLGESEGWNDTFEDITRKMFPTSKEILLTPITGGYSGSLVFNADSWDRSGRKEMPFILKVGSWSEIGDEFHGYEDHVKRYIQNNATQIMNHRKLGEFGGILYNFVGINGGEGNIISLEDYYSAHNTKDVLQALDNLFRNVLRSWYGQPKLKELFLYEEYNFFFQYDQIKRYAVEKFGVSANEKYIELPYNLGTSINPLYFVENVMPERRSQATSAYESSTHGDLNMRNVLMDENLNMWLIDFAFTRYGHILRDVAKMETALKLECVDIGSEEKLKQVIELETRFLNAEKLSDIPQIPSEYKEVGVDFDNDDVLKAFNCIQRLREYGNMITLMDDDISQYLLGLLSYTLSTVSFISLNDYEKKYAWISSSLICQKLI
ncbi:MAG: anti-sigma factor antagonist [Methanobacterium sp.]|nr:anti-sigma factor antagonist [Methanobacterium sp.]